MKFKNTTTFVNQNGNLQSSRFPNYGHLFKNVGEAIAYVNDFIILPGEQLDTRSDVLEDATNYRIKFEVVNSATFPSVPVTQLQVITKERI